MAYEIPSKELTYPPDKAYLKMIFLFPRWDMLVAWRVIPNPSKQHGPYFFIPVKKTAKVQPRPWRLLLVLLLSSFFEALPCRGIGRGCTDIALVNNLHKGNISEQPS